MLRDDKGGNYLLLVRCRFLEERYASGLRGLHSYLIIDEIGDYRSILQQIRENYSDCFKFALGPWWVSKVLEEVLLEVKETAERHDLKYTCMSQKLDGK